jgi:hypothetical protein
MEQVTQANSAQTEELASTAQSLAVQAQQLQTLVGRFKLSETTPVAAGRGSRRTATALTKRPEAALTGVGLVHRLPRAGDDSFDES